MSSSISIRSRAVCLPRACCRSTAASEPACTASSTRCSRSASFPAVVWMSTSPMSPHPSSRRRTTVSAVTYGDPLDTAATAGGRSPTRTGSGAAAEVVPETGSTNADLAARARARCAVRVRAGHRPPDRRPRSPGPHLDRAARQLDRHVGAAATRSGAGDLDLAAAAGRSRRGRQPARDGRTCRRCSSGPTTCWSTGRRSAASWPSGSTAPSGAACVLGLGINVHLAADELPVPTATSLAVLRPGQTLRPGRDHGHRARGPGAALPPLGGLPRHGAGWRSTWLAAAPSAGPSGCCRLTGRQRPRARRSMWTPRGGSGSARPPASRSSPPVTCRICADQRLAG